MSRKLMLAGVAALAALATAPAQAAPFTCDTPNCVLPAATVTGGPGSITGVTAYRISLGLQWNFGTMQPEIVLAARGTRTQAHEQVYGGQLDLAFPVSLAAPVQWPTVRALGLAGNREAIGQAGIGLQLGSVTPLVAAGIQGPYMNAGVNLLFGQGGMALHPIIGFNSFGRAVAPRVIRANGTTTYSCPSGYVLATASSLPYPVNPALVNGAGKTCNGDA